MSILLGLTPFIAFFVLMRLSTPLIALAAATIISAVLMGRGAMRGGGVKILELGSLLLFGALTLYTLAAHPDWSIAGVRLAVDGGLALIVLISIAIRQPFTMQYAKEQVPAEFWRHPIFIRTNDLISGVWLLDFAVSAACDAAAIYLPSVPVGVLVAISVAALVGAIWFTAWYPAQVRKRIPRGAAAST
jgi:hypothetical protein